MERRPDDERGHQRIAMKPTRLPSLNDDQTALLRAKLLGRAARLYEGEERWAEAARCRGERGEAHLAAELYLRAGDVGRAAEALLAAGRYAEALEQFRTWEKTLPETDVISRVRALLGQSACHQLAAPAASVRRAAREAYRRARALIAGAAARGGPAARCWSALGEHGDRVDRYDLVHEGFEQALDACGERPWQRLEVARNYLSAAQARGDRLLSRDLEERLAEWGSPTEKLEVDLDVWKTEIEREAGAWLKRFKIDPSGEEPEQFRHLFICVRGYQYMARGAIVTGSSWHRANYAFWNVLHGYRDTPKEISRILTYLAYLGPTWDSRYPQLSRLFNDDGGRKLPIFVNYPDRCESHIDGDEIE